MAKVIPISSIICNNIKLLKATKQRISLHRINLFSRIHLGILRPMCLFKSSKFNVEKFDIIFANCRKSTNRHKDDYTIIYFAKTI